MVRLGADDPGEARGAAGVARKHLREVAVAQVAGQQLAEQVAEVGGDGEVAALVEAAPPRGPGQRPWTLPPRTPPPITNDTLAWPWSVPRLPFSRTVRPNSVIVTTTTSSMRSPRSLVERGQGAAELAQALGELALHAAFRGVMVPAADLGEGDLHADVGLDELGDLLEARRRSGRAGTGRPAAGV